MGIMQHGGHKTDDAQSNDAHQGAPHSDSNVAKVGAECPARCPTPRRSAAAQEPALADGGMQHVSATWLPAPDLSTDGLHSLLRQPGLLLRPSSAASATPREPSTRDLPAGNASVTFTSRERTGSPRQLVKTSFGQITADASIHCVSSAVHREPVVVDVRSQLRSSLPPQYVRMPSPGQHRSAVAPILGQHTLLKPTPRDDTDVRKSQEKAWRT